MCHFTLPRYPGARLEERKRDGRYADDVMYMFQQEALKHRTKITEYEAKIFGGGNMMKSKGQNTEDSIGTKNATAAMTLLMKENVDILVAHVGEFGHRRIVFDTGTGSVWVRHIDNDGTRRESINGKV
jgi:chemotaxis protein CheD